MGSVRLEASVAWVRCPKKRSGTVGLRDGAPAATITVAAGAS